MKKLSLEDIKNPSMEEDYDFKKIYKESFIDVTKTVERPPVALSIGEYNYKGNLYPNPTFTYGEISGTIAPKKTKKTYMRTILEASYIGGNSNEYFPNIKTFNNDRKAVLAIDTEQGEYYSQWAAKRVHEMVGSRFDKYYPFSLKKYSKKIRLRFVDDLIKEMHKEIGWVSIDGIVDICLRFNDELESTKVIEKLMEWSSLGIHIHGILHQTFEKDKGRGHLGTMFQEKLETSIFLSDTDPKIKNAPIKVHQRDSRGAPFDDFHFDLDMNTLIPKECTDNTWI